ncbi:UTP--glucose-1-phosphate uridylyltransferase GalU [Hyphomonas sp.]|uniref:UTP--glucose-1-phosphate uridylyltransferase GalU n=1 Tax=Hyphomonas sp. TaxID=87 RepID=UPI0025BF751F|nr:UTP--glucose-1-phosphate uridylyltransferase GalU [Hyphomonas sp.]MBI1399469.1 UTP--glucose-1-phosphate uridylyltransferase GalU [Hyphomonas sp.]
MRIRKAVLPVAGLGTRVLPATKAIPKELLPVVDRPVIQYVVDEAREAGIEHIVFVTGRGKGAIEDYFDHAYELETQLNAKNKTDILAAVEASRLPAGASSFVRQQAPLGLGHAVWCARDVIGHEPFAVLLPDVIVKGKPSSLKQMADAFEKVGGNIIAVDPVPEDRVSSYGVIAPKSRDGRLISMSGMVEKPPRETAPSNLAITGRYILQPEIFGLLEKQGAGAGGEIQLTDAMAKLMERQPFYAYEFEGTVHDCGNKTGYFEAVLTHALDNPDTADFARALVKAAAAR